MFQESNKAADDDRELELEIERELEEEMRNNAEMKFKEQQALLMKEKEDVRTCFSLNLMGNCC